MAATVQTDATLTLTLDGTDVSAQVINASFQPSVKGAPEIVPVADGTTVAVPGDLQAGSISGEVFKDFSATGISRLLMEAAAGASPLPFVYTENPGAVDGSLAAWTGTCYVSPTGVDFAPTKVGRHALNLTVTDSALAADV